MQTFQASATLSNRNVSSVIFEYGDVRNVIDKRIKKFSKSARPSEMTQTMQHAKSDKTDFWQLNSIMAQNKKIQQK